MPAKTKPRPPDHLADARSARCVGGLSYRDGHHQYVLRAGSCYAPDHPAVIAYPDKFQPSGEAPHPTTPARDHTPRPRKVRAEVEAVVVVRCVEKGCDWATEVDADDAAAVKRARSEHRHTIAP